MKRPFKKAAAFITAIVTALTMGAVPASAASAKAPKISVLSSAKYDMVIQTEESVILANTNITKKNASMVVVGPAGKAYKRKNTIGFARIVSGVDYSGNTHYYDLKPGTNIDLAFGGVIVEKNDKNKTQYLILNNGKFIKIDRSSMTFHKHFYTKKTGEDTITYYSYNGKKIMTVKDNKYGEFIENACNAGFMVFCKYFSETDSCTYTVTYRNKVIKTFEGYDYGKVWAYPDPNGGFVEDVQTGTRYNSAGKKIKGPDYYNYGLNCTFDIGFNSDSDLLAWDALTGQLSRKECNVVGNWCSFGSHVISPISNKAETKFGVLIIKCP